MSTRPTLLLGLRSRAFWPGMLGALGGMKKGRAPEIPERGMSLGRAEWHCVCVIRSASCGQGEYAIAYALVRRTRKAVCQACRQAGKLKRKVVTRGLNFVPSELCCVDQPGRVLIDGGRPERLLPNPWSRSMTCTPFSSPPTHYTFSSIPSESFPTVMDPDLSALHHVRNILECAGVCGTGIV